MFTPAAVTERWHYEPTIRDSSLRERIERLLLLQLQGHDTQRELDSYLHIANLPWCSIDHAHARFLITRPDDLVNASNIPDIGQIVRRLLLKWPDNSIIFRMYQYSMPFIKHNRLNFPSRKMVTRADVVHLIQAVLVTCLGLHSPVSKRPTWVTRRKLHAFFLHLLRHGSTSDMYIFCHHNVSLVRLALLEHFVHFTDMEMCVENSIMTFLIDANFDRRRVLRLVSFITDNFRQSALQCTSAEQPIDWNVVLHRAQQAIERCNRTCKAIPSPKHDSVSLHPPCFNAATLHTAFSTPQIRPLDIIALSPRFDLRTLANLFRVHSHIERYPLPIYIQHRQYSSMQSATSTRHDVFSHVKPYLHVCLHCNVVNCDVASNMRVTYMQNAVCHNCHHNDYVVVLNTLGSLVRIGSHYYHFCVDCLRVHRWTSDSTEFSSCAKRPPRDSPPTKKCVVCQRLNGVSTISVVDKRLGLQQAVHLCFKHMPPPTQRPYIHDLGCLRRLIQHNLANGLGGSKTAIVSYNTDRRSF